MEIKLRSAGCLGTEDSIENFLLMMRFDGYQNLLLTWKHILNVTVTLSNTLAGKTKILALSQVNVSVRNHNMENCISPTIVAVGLLGP